MGSHYAARTRSLPKAEDQAEAGAAHAHVPRLCSPHHGPHQGDSALRGPWGGITGI